MYIARRNNLISERFSPYMNSLTRLPFFAGASDSFSEPVVALNVRTSAAAEWTWVIGRLVLIVAAFAGAIAFLSGTSAFGLILGLIGGVLIADLGIGWLLYSGRVRKAFVAGLALDTITVLVGWAIATRLLAGTENTNDIYLILFPILIASVARLGWPLGAAQAALFIVWVAGVNVIFLDSSDYAIQQQPLRIFFMVATVLLAIWLIAQIRRERERAESKWRESEALAGLGRIISSSPDIDEVYHRFADAVKDLIPFDRLSVSTISEQQGAMTLRYVQGEEFSEREKGVSNLLEVSLTGYALQAKRPIRVGVGSQDQFDLKIENGPNGGARFRSSLCAPVVADGRAIGTITLHAYKAGSYGENHEYYLLRVADQISGALATELSHAREMGLIEAHGELEAQNRELERVNEEKTKFLSTVSHELKTPLTSMLAFADILKRNKNRHLSELELEHLTVIQRNGNRLSILIDDLVDIAKFDAGTLHISMNEFDIRDLLDDIVKSFEPIIEGKKQELHLIAPEGPIVINGDQARLAQVITNLISNASKYSPENTAVVVEANVAGNRLGISVSDSGFGISDEDQDKLFMPFFRAERDVASATPGTGLGLAISRSIVELHDGEINVESELGAGSTFWISIPGVVTDESDDDMSDEIGEPPSSDDSGYTAREAA